ncbi:hypothetical protein F5H01DRAFT_348553 [Linnemannia elongata]|nr:hypothetical protein F5H01DRAFT_348553 [Linnemannia elongata]
MHISSSMVVLSSAALTYSGKLRNTYNGLCLDAPYGLSQSSSLNLASCDAVKHGNWLVLQMDDRFWLKNAENQESNNGVGWCVDFWKPRTGHHPTLWLCNFSAGQMFLRDPNTRPGTLSFMTSYAVDESGTYDLAVQPDDSLGALANFLPVNSSSKANCVKYEWITFN